MRPPAPAETSAGRTDGSELMLLYNILLVAAAVLGLPLIAAAVLASAKLRRTLPYRMGLKPLPAAIGRADAAPPAHRPIWIHALSVGEVLSAVPLVKALKVGAPNRSVLFSVSTRTGFDVADRELAATVEAVFFAPYDFSFLIRRMVQRIDPALVVIVETDIWPNFLYETSRRRVPVLLVNARLSQRSLRGYKRVAFWSKWLFSGFAKICVQSHLDAERFGLLGIPADRIALTGNVKFDQPADPVSGDPAQPWRRRLNLPPGGKIWLAGSTHPGEEAVIREVFIRLRQRHPDAVLITAPRDPRRAPGVADQFNACGFATALVSGLAPDGGQPPADVIVVDTIGDLRTLYALADVTFIGGSLVDRGGHNPLEPAAFAKPVLFGTDMSDFAAVAQLLLEAGGGLQVRDAAQLLAAVAMLLADPRKAAAMGQAAGRIFNAHKGAVAKNTEIILNELSGR